MRMRPKQAASAEEAPTNYWRISAAAGGASMWVAMIICSLVLFAAAIMNAASVSRSASSSAAADYKKYTILLKPRRDGVVMDDAARREWYSSYLPDDGDEFTAHGEPRIILTYNYLLDGFVARLTDDELQAMSRKPGFWRSFPEAKLYPATTRTPGFLSLAKGSGAWESSSYGRGVIIGVIDSGIDSGHPSFHDTGMPPPPAKWRGSCTGDGARRCNNKLIGTTSFVGGGYDDDPMIDDDNNGHGTKCASVAAGNFVANASADNGLANGTASGVAPGAHLAMYKVCTSKQDGCSDYAIVKALEQAALDGVDIISASLAYTDTETQGRRRPIEEDLVAIGAYRAVSKAGVLVVAAAGNQGPSPGSVRNDAPWFLTVGAGSVDRRLFAHLILHNGHVLIGESLQNGYHAGSITEYKPLLCPAGANGTRQWQCMDLPAERVRGRIVVCDEVKLRVETVRKLYSDGAAMVVLVASEAWGDSVVLWNWSSSMVQVTQERGDRLRAYCDKYPDAAASQVIFDGTVLGVGESPMVAGFSGRGPGRFGNILKPDVIAPGLNVLVAASSSAATGFVIDSGTSFSAAHVAGVAALVKSAHPDWSPAAIRSAMVTTTDKLNNNFYFIQDERRVAATLYAMGAGHVNATQALDPGLLFDLDPIDYTAFLCYHALDDDDDEDALQEIIRGGHEEMKNMSCAVLPTVDDDSSLNLPSIVVPVNKTVQRTVTYVGPAGPPAMYKAFPIIGGDDDPPVSVTVSPNTLVFYDPGDKATFSVSAQSESTQSGYLVWRWGSRSVESPLIVLLP